MKIAVLIGDGMGDYPVPELGGRTPLQAADIPNMRRLAAAGRRFLVRTAPEGMYPGSDVANLSLLGYDPLRNYTGRAPLEAAGAGIILAENEVAFRCNLVTIEDGRMVDYSAGHIRTEEAQALISTLKDALDNDRRRFHAGVSYRHLVIWQDGPAEAHCTPPHDITGKETASYLPRGPGADLLRSLMEDAGRILEAHPVNRKRRSRGERPANAVWLWGAGKAAKLPSYRERFGLSGGVVSAVDLVRGIGILAGLEAPRIPGATGFLDTDYQAKVSAAVGFLEKGDFVYVHVEAPDECGHMGDVEKKITAIEAFDAEVVGPMLQRLRQRGEDFRIIVGTDHRTPVSLRTHSAEPIPLLVYDSTAPMTEETAPFDEFINGGQAQGMAYEVIASLLTTAEKSR